MGNVEKNYEETIERTKQKEQIVREVYNEKKTWKQRVWDYMVITFGAIVYSIALGLFLDPNNLASGGVTGIAIIVNRVTNIDTGTWILIINIPLVLLGTWKFGFKFIVSTLYALICITVFTNLLSGYDAITTDPLLAALTGGALFAVGIGLIFKAGATTAGTDIIVKLLRLKYKHLKTGFLFLMLDLLIVASSLFVFHDINTALYAFLSLLVTTALLDVVLYGSDEAKLIYIISDESYIIGDRILSELDIGVTYLEGKGGFSEVRKRVIMCVVRKPLAPSIEELVKEEDPTAFMIVSSASEIFGEGYKNIYAEKI